MFIEMYQCLENIWMFKYIRIVVDKMIHLSKYSFDFKAKHIFTYLLVDLMEFYMVNIKIFSNIQMFIDEYLKI